MASGRIGSVIREGPAASLRTTGGLEGSRSAPGPDTPNMKRVRPLRLDGSSVASGGGAAAPSTAWAMG